MNSAPTAYSPGLGRREAEPVGLLGEELVRDLHQDAGAVAGARIGADRAAMLEVAQDGERVLDQLVRLAALDVGDEADAAGILLERRIVEALRLLRSSSARSKSSALIFVLRLSAHLPRPQRLMASRRRAHRWSLAASLARALERVWQLMLGGLAAMAPLDHRPRMGRMTNRPRAPGGPPTGSQTGTAILS